MYENGTSCITKLTKFFQMLNKRFLNIKNFFLIIKINVFFLIEERDFNPLFLTFKKMYFKCFKNILKILFANWDINQVTTS